MTEAIMQFKLLPFLCLLVLAATTPANALCVTEVDVVDVKAGRVLSNQMILIEDGRIERVADTGSSEVPCTDSFSARGKYAIPGLWDMHVHRSSNPAHWPIYVANGVVGVRDLFGRESPAEQRHMAAAAPAAPEFYVSGPIIDGPPGIWDGSDLAANADEAAEIVARQAAAGYDFVKVYEFLSKDAYVAVLRQASALGLPAAGHIAESMSLLEASDLGLRSVEHLDDVAVSCSRNEAALRERGAREFFESLRVANEAYASFDPSKCNALARQLIRNDTWVVPTLAVMEGSAAAEHPYPKAVAYSEYLDPATADFILPGEPTPQDELEILQEDFRINLELTGVLHAAGVPMLAGTDVMNPNIFPGFSLHDELKLLVQAGLSELDALRAATINAARFLRRESEFGNVAAGMAADLVLLDGNPLEDITNTTAIFAVILDGRLITRSELDELLNAHRTPE